MAPIKSGAWTACWGVVQLVGHLTVNEDGEGSNPSAPANFPLENLGIGFLHFVGKVLAAFR